MAIKDFREFLKVLEEKGEAKKVTAEVDWNEEIGAIAQEAFLYPGPAPIFTNIKGYKNTHGKKISMLSDGNLRRISIALGLKESSTRADLLHFWRKKSRQSIRPILTSNAPCKEVIHKGEDVDLLELPVPKLHPLDGGRYIMTCHIVVTKDPESGWVNVGTYRGMLLDKNSIGVLMFPTAHWGAHAAKYKAMGKPMPVAVALGVNLPLMMVATVDYPYGICEYDVVGAVGDEPLELVKAETVDLEVPAKAEIVLEGEISLDPSTFRPEGPFGEYTGHYTSLRPELRPVFKVNCLTHRQDPIFTASPSGTSPAVTSEVSGNQGEHAWLAFVPAALLWNHLEESGVRGVTGVGAFGPAGAITVVSINQQYYGHARQVANAIWGSVRAGASKYVIVTDSDIDVSDPHKVFLAISNRAQGSKGLVIFPDSWGSAVDTSVHPDIKAKLDGSAKVDRIFIDATWPFEWEPRAEWGGLKHPPGCRSSEDMVRKVKQRWQEFGLTPPTGK